MPHIDSAFKAIIYSSSYQANSYKDVLIFGGNYSFIFNNQKIKNSKDYWFLRINAEASGNLLLALAQKIHEGRVKQGLVQYYQILGPAICTICQGRHRSQVQL